MPPVVEDEIGDMTLSVATYLCVIHQKHSPRKDDRIVSENDRKEEDHEIEIGVESPAAVSTFVADPKGCGFQDAGDIEGDGHVSEGEEEDEDIIRQDALATADNSVAYCACCNALGSP